MLLIILFLIALALFWLAPAHAQKESLSMKESLGAQVIKEKRSNQGVSSESLKPSEKLDAKKEKSK